jgi:hypothetical protein
LQTELIQAHADPGVTPLELDLYNNPFRKITVCLQDNHAAYANDTA